MGKLIGELKWFLEIILSGETAGEGIKKTPAYETPLSKEGLDRWRDEFWGKYLEKLIIE